MSPEDTGMGTDMDLHLQRKVFGIGHHRAQLLAFDLKEMDMLSMAIDFSGHLKQAMNNYSNVTSSIRGSWVFHSNSRLLADSRSCMCTQHSVFRFTESVKTQKGHLRHQPLKCQRVDRPLPLPVCSPCMMLSSVAHTHKFIVALFVKIFIHWGSHSTPRCKWVRQVTMLPRFVLPLCLGCSG